jgi:hypothetical protein
MERGGCSGSRPLGAGWLILPRFHADFPIKYGRGWTSSLAQCKRGWKNLLKTRDVVVLLMSFL